MSMPKPIAYVEEEGGAYQAWVSPEERRASAEAQYDKVAPDWREGGIDPTVFNMINRNELQRNPPKVHAIVFEDGSVFDTVNGWRWQGSPKQAEKNAETLSAVRMALGVTIDNQPQIEVQP